MSFTIGKIGLTECLSGECEPSKYAYFKVHYAFFKSEPKYAYKRSAYIKTAC